MSISKQIEPLLSLATQFETVLGQAPLQGKGLQKAVSNLYLCMVEKEGETELSVHSKWDPKHWFSRLKIKR